jgi:hypothetical protein
MGGLFGGGGGPAPQIRPSQEYQKIFNIFQKQVVPGYEKFVAGQPALGQISDIAQQGATALPGYQQMLNQAYQAGTKTPAEAESWLRSAYASRTSEPMLRNQLAAQYGTAVPTGALTGPLMQTYQNYLTPILQSQGRLTPQLQREATQQAAARNAMGGMATTNPGMFAEALNRDKYREARYGNALNQAMGLTQNVSGLDTAGLNRALQYTQGMEGLNQGQLQNALTAGQGVVGFRQQPFSNALQYAQASSGLRGTAMQDLAGAYNQGIGAFTQLLNPAATGVSSAVGFNANAQAAAQNAAANNKSGTTTGILSAVGSVAAAY